MASGIKNKIPVLIFIICVLASLMPAALYAQDIKEPNVAGGFYPANQQELSGLVDSFLYAAKPESVNGEIFALISPHAGYPFSGKTAAYGYKLIKGLPYKTVVVIG
ncbi:MAG: AmmeMemoRadiSam system protein B, partial [Candidatus Omnitrophica bacterium]|nr:AmmeMemoRadiSam system protein B [Candidatus Omnitrophota bacterium]